MFIKKSHYLLVAMLVVSSHAIICMENPKEDHSKQEESGQEKETERTFRERMAQAKEDTYIRDNSIRYRMASNAADHAIQGLMEFCAKTASDSVLEVVRRELDIQYDNNPTVGRQLEEILSGITIAHNAVNLTDELAKKETALAKYLTQTNQLEQKKRLAEIDNDADHTFKNLRHLRNDFIDQLNGIRQKRNPNFKPYGSQS